MTRRKRFGRARATDRDRAAGLYGKRPRGRRTGSRAAMECEVYIELAFTLVADGIGAHDRLGVRVFAEEQFEVSAFLFGRKIGEAGAAQRDALHGRGQALAGQNGEVAGRGSGVHASHLMRLHRKCNIRGRPSPLTSGEISQVPPRAAAVLP